MTACNQYFLSLKQKFFITIFFVMVSPWVSAVVDGHKYPFDNEQDAQRFEQLAQDLRCPKCQNQNLADSDAPVAKDLRDKVYTLMQEGKTDDEVVDYLVARYGDFVRYKPPFRIDTLLLWISPILLLLFGFLVIRSLIKQQSNEASNKAAGLSAEEEQRLQALLADTEASQPAHKHTDPVNTSTTQASDNS